MSERILGQVDVTIVEAKSIECLDPTHLPSPYINLRVKNLSTLLKAKKQRTDVKEGQAPSFTENNLFTYYLSDFDHEVLGNSMTLNCLSVSVCIELESLELILSDWKISDLLFVLF
jgi:hypothetical protein